jgi:hypothetical protein
MFTRLDSVLSITKLMITVLYIILHLITAEIFPPSCSCLQTLPQSRDSLHEPAQLLLRLYLLHTCVLYTHIITTANYSGNWKIMGTSDRTKF